MSKKFDVVIGNPPYQDEPRGDATDMPPIYHLFMEAAYSVGRQVVLITPARFLSNAGRTPKVWNKKMLDDPHLCVAHFEPDSNQLFPGLPSPIKGGVAVTYRDTERTLGPISFFTKHPELATIIRKTEDAESIMDVTINRSSHSYSRRLFSDHPEAAVNIGHSNLSQILSNAFKVLRDQFHTEKPDDELAYVSVLGLHGRQRVFRWLRRDYLRLHPTADRWKVAVPEANGSGTFGAPLATAGVLAPNTIVTNTFVTVGSLDSKEQGERLLRYLKTKFARAMLGILKVTQHTAQPVWKYVPNQDFTSASDIDWSKSIPEIDQQLYAKYGLDADEIAFIESHVKPME